MKATVSSGDCKGQQHYSRDLEKNVRRELKFKVGSYVFANHPQLAHIAADAADELANRRYNAKSPIQCQIANTMANFRYNAKSPIQCQISDTVSYYDNRLGHTEYSAFSCVQQIIIENVIPITISIDILTQPPTRAQLTHCPHETTQTTQP